MNWNYGYALQTVQWKKTPASCAPTFSKIKNKKLQASLVKFLSVDCSYQRGPPRPVLSVPLPEYRLLEAGLQRESGLKFLAGAFYTTFKEVSEVKQVRLAEEEFERCCLNLTFPPSVYVGVFFFFLINPSDIHGRQINQLSRSSLVEKVVSVRLRGWVAVC